MGEVDHRPALWQTMSALHRAMALESVRTQLKIVFCLVDSKY